MNLEKHHFPILFFSEKSVEDATVFLPEGVNVVYVNREKIAEFMKKNANFIAPNKDISTSFRSPNR